MRCCRRAHRSADGSYRAIAARAVPGRPVGGFRYYGTRPDDPNDIVPHEHRRELRALKVFGAWTNLVDMKAGNTLDAVVIENGRSVVRHYLQDVGSTFGTGANGPREYDEGWELLYDGDLLLKRLVTLGFFIAPWQTVDYDEHPAIGRFEGDAFDPVSWRPRVATAAFLRARADDSFWAARRVAAFTDEMIRAAVESGGYSDPAAEELLTQRADQAARQDRRRVSSFDQSARRFRARSRRPVDVPERRCRRRRGPGACQRLSRFVGDIRQRHGRDAGDRRGHDLAAERHRITGAVAGNIGYIRARPGRRAGAGPRRVDTAGRCLLYAHR